MRLSSCQGKVIYHLCRPIYTQCACSWCHHFRFAEESKDPMEDRIFCGIGKVTEEFWYTSNSSRSCPYSAVCGHNYDELVKARLSVKQTNTEQTKIAELLQKKLGG